MLLMRIFNFACPAHKKKQRIKIFDKAELFAQSGKFRVNQIYHHSRILEPARCKGCPVKQAADFIQDSKNVFILKTNFNAAEN